MEELSLQQYFRHEMEEKQRKDEFVYTVRIKRGYAGRYRNGDS